MRDNNTNYKAKMIYETIPKKYLAQDDMYKVFMECCILSPYIEHIRDRVSNMLIEDDLTDLRAVNIGKAINDYTNFIDHLDYICEDFCNETNIDENIYVGLLERYNCEREQYFNKLQSLDNPKLIHETIINEYNIHLLKMIDIMNGCFNSGYAKAQATTDGVLKSPLEINC